MAKAPYVDRIRWRRRGLRNDYEEGERRRDHHGHHGRTGLEVGMGRPEEDEAHEEAESYTCYDGSNTHREEASDDDNHDGDYSHVEVVHGRSRHQVDNRLGGRVVESVSGSGRCVGPLPGSVAVSRRYHVE